MAISEKAKRGASLLHGNFEEAIFGNYDFNAWVDALSLESSLDGLDFNGNIVNDNVKSVINEVNEALRDYDKEATISLLPVRLETKYIGGDLWIRIFPDQIFIKSHKLSLNQAEFEDGMNYWNSYFNADNDLGRQKEAWRLLCTKYGSTRAGWIIKSLFPENVELESSQVYAQTSLLDEVDKMIDEIKGEGNGIKGPELIVDTMYALRSSIEEKRTVLVNNAVNNRSNGAILKLSISNSKRRLQSRYVTVLNPYINSSTKIRRDDFLVRPYLELKRTYEIFPGDIDKISESSNFVSLSLIIEGLDRFVVSRTKKGSLINFLNKQKVTLDAVLSSLNLNNFKGYENFLLVDELHRCKASLLINNDRLNPFIDSRFRQDKLAGDIVVAMMQRIDATLLQIRGVVYMNDENILFSISYLLEKNKGKLTNNEFEAFCLDFLPLLISFTDSKETFGSTEKDFCQILCYISSSYQSFIQIANNALEEDLKVTSSIITVLNGFVGVIDKVFSTYSAGRLTEWFFVSQLNANVNSLDTNSSNPINWLSGAKRRLSGLEGEINFTDRSKDYGFVQLAFLLNYQMTVDRYFIQVNPLSNPRDIYSGLSKDLSAEFESLEQIYQLAISRLFQSDTNFQSAINQLIFADKEIFKIEPNYTTPDSAVEYINSLDLRIKSIVNSIDEKKITLKSCEYLKEKTAELKKKLYENYVSHFCKNPEIAGRLGETTNVRVETSAFQFVASLEAIVADKGEFEIEDSSLSGSNFSFSLVGQEPIFPSVIIAEGNGVQQYSDVLPTRFIAIGILSSENDSSTDVSVQNAIKFVWPGKKVNQAIKFGFSSDEDESSFTFDVQNGEIIGHPDVEWMLDKDAAERSGLAIKVPQLHAGDSISRLLVVGINEDNTSTDSHGEKWKDLFESHQFTNGIELLKLDSPTNNSETESSAYSSDEGLYDESHGIFASNVLFTPTSSSFEYNITDGQRTSEFLALPYSSFYHVKGADSKKISNGMIGHRLLFPGTIGAYMEEGLDTILNRDNRERIEDFFGLYVSPRGHAPALRIGRQPYGLVLTGYLHGFDTNRDNYKHLSEFDFFDPNFEPYVSSSGAINTSKVIVPKNILPGTVEFNKMLEKRFFVRQIQTLKVFDIEWRRLAEKYIRNVYPENVQYHKNEYLYKRAILESQGGASSLGNVADYGQIHFNDILSLAPISKRFYSRFSYSTATFKFLNGILQDTIYPSNLGVIVDGLVNGNNAFNGLSGFTGILRQNLENAIQGVIPQNLADFLENANIERGVYFDFYESKWQDLNPLIYNDSSNNNPLPDRLRSARIFKATNAIENIPLKAGDSNSSDDQAAFANWLQWLKGAHPKEIFANNDYSELPSSSLAFQLFRNSILLKHREISAKLLIEEGLISESQYASLGTPERAIHLMNHVEQYIEALSDGSHESLENYQKYSSIFTKWDPLFMKLFRAHPQILYNFDDVVHYEFNSTNFLENRASIELELSDSSYEAHLPWRDSSLLKSLIPDFTNIFLVDDDFHVNHKTLADFLHDDAINDLNGRILNIRGELKRFMAGLEAIESLDQKELEQLCAEAIDLSTHRVDAWIQGLFAKRLFELRKRRTSKNGQIFNQKNYIGAYGYVENLMKNEPSNIPATSPASSDIGNVFIPTHSIGHAITASILYNNYFINKVQNESLVRNRSSVNLSSARVRKALAVLQGVRAGNTLGMILGQDFERGLLDSSVITQIDDESNLILDVYVYRLRSKFPLRKSNGEMQELEDVGSGEVLDGLALLDHISAKLGSSLAADKTILDILTAPDLSKFGTIELSIELAIGDVSDFESISATKEKELRIIAFYVNEIAETIDALADLMIAEGVFQITNGNSRRAAASLDLFSNGGFVEPDIINSPQKLNYFQNKVIVNYPAGGSDAWTSNESIGKYLDTALNSWLVNSIGIDNAFALAYNYKEQGVPYSSEFLISQLGLEPIDLIPFVNSTSAVSTKDLQKFIKFKIKRNFPEREAIELLWDQEVSLGMTKASELLSVLSSAKELLIKSNVVLESDLSVNNSGDGLNFNVQEFRAKVSSCRGNLLSVHSQLDSLPSEVSESYAEIANNALEYAFICGIHGTLPDIELTDDLSVNSYLESLVSLVAMAKEIAAIRIQDTESLLVELQNTSLTTNQVYQRGKEILEILLGNFVYIFPSTQFGSDLISAAVNRFNLIPQDEEYLLEVWLQANAMIRNPLSSLLEFSALSNAIASEDNEGFLGLNLQPVQLPYELNDRWCGLPKIQNSQQEGALNQVNKINLILTNPNLITSEMAFCGFKVDDWQEFIPESEITSGIALHTKQPMAESPQAIMVAVPTNDTVDWHWSLNDVAHSVLQAIDMSKYRTLEPDQITSLLNSEDYQASPDSLDIRHSLSKIFPANMVDAYPETNSNATGSNIGGNRVSMDFSKSN